MQSICKHCGAICEGFPTAAIKDYCCLGCEIIASTIKDLKLEDFYRYAAQRLPSSQSSQPKNRNYEWLENKEVVEKYITARDGDRLDATLPIDGIHCAGCLWLLEALPKRVEGLAFARVDIGRGEIQVGFDSKKITLRSVALTLNKLGYPIRLEEEARLPAIARRELWMLGVAAFCALNTMMLAISLFQGLYTPIEKQYQQLFAWLSMLLTLPVVSWCSLPFYRNSVEALRLRRFHVDQPIALAILSAFLLSVFDTFTSRPYLYFDSICSLVAFMTLGRIIQRHALNRARTHLTRQLGTLPQTTRIERNEVEHEQLSSLIIAGDIVKLASGETATTDAVVIEGSVTVDEAVLTGESTPKSKVCGDTILAGTRVYEGIARAKALSSQRMSHLGKLLSQLQHCDLRECSFSRFADRAAGYYVVATLLVAMTAFIWWSSKDLESAFTAFLTVLIVTCPCALGIAIPAALGILVGKSAQRGIFISSIRIVDTFPTVKHFLFDKTGTLTSTNPKLIKSIAHQPEVSNLGSIVTALASIDATHPLSAALLASRNVAPLPLSGVERVAGRGVNALLNGTRYYLGSVTWAKEFDIQIPTETQALIEQCHSVVVLFDPSQILGTFAFSSEINPDAQQTLHALGEKQWILSGDTDWSTKSCGRDLGIPPHRAIGGLSPEAKRMVLRNLAEPALMVGDGINDTLALSEACVAVGIRGGLDITMKVADVYLASGKISDLAALKRAINRSRYCAYAILFVALCYNVVGASLAVCGLMTPLIAAIIMPLNALMVLSLALFWPRF